MQIMIAGREHDLSASTAKGPRVLCSRASFFPALSLGLLDMTGRPARLMYF